ncbi:hypothetical protein BDF14DRAFT_1770984 [Spinellus fusiger]|nr:hypothetical protein BDF14DRAFT_1770984 [Spinellus fusiger]
MRPQCGIYYYEIEIISKGVDGHIGIGFCWPFSKLNRLPGWEEHSWGYHGDDGHLFSGPSTSKQYGPKFGTGDVIGCGVDFRDRTAFYTKNGVYLGTAFTKVVGDSLYPFVGFKTTGERIKANFGNMEYMFDIKQYIRAERRHTLDTLFSTTQVLPKPMSVKAQIMPSALATAESQDVMNALVLDYLDYYGYENTSNSLKSTILSLKDPLVDKHTSIALPNDKDSADACHRKDIRRSVMIGDMDKVIEQCEAFYPGLWESSPQMLFHIRCQGFVELIRAAQEELESSQHLSYSYDSDSMDTESEETKTPLKRNSSLEREYCEKRRRKDNEDGQSTKPYREKLSSNALDNTCESVSFSSLLKDAMVYGEKLQKHYGTVAVLNPKASQELRTLFSVLAYEDPTKEEAVSFLFDISQKEKLASDLNAAILVLQNQHATPSIERLFAQLTTTISELVLEGSGKAAIIRPHRDCFL